MPLSKYRFRLRQIRQAGTTRAGKRIEESGESAAIRSAKRKHRGIAAAVPVQVWKARVVS
jgi:hypothetical protein